MGHPTKHDELTAAIGAHARWKSRLLKAIEDGKSDVSVSDAKRDDVCQFGKWLYGTNALVREKRYAKVRELHRQFHHEAAKVLELAVAGRKEAAVEEMRMGKPFLKSSSALTQEVVAWREES